MSKLKSKLARRIMAIVLSGAMVMSNMSAYAAEVSTEVQTESASDVEETAAAKETAETESPVAESSESAADKATAEEAKSEDATEAKTEDTAETKSGTEAEESTVTETEESSAENKTSEVVEEETTEVETTEVETTEVETTEEETTEEEKTEVEKDNKDGGQTYTFDVTTLTAAADKEAISEGTTFSDGYFKAIGEVVKRIGSSGSVTSTEVGKYLTGAIQFTVTGTADVVIVMSSTGGSNTSVVGIVNEAGTILPNEENITQVTSTAKVTMTYRDLPAGTYRVSSPGVDGDGMNRGARLYSVEVEEFSLSSVTTDYTYDATTLTATADKEAIPEGTTFSDGYFKAVGEVVKRTGSSGSVTSTEVGKYLTGAIQFTVTGTADVEIVMSSTGGSNTSVVGIVNEGNDILSNEENITQVTSTAKVTMTYKGLTAGTYRVSSPGVDGDGMNRGARLYSIKVTETTGGARPPRAEWTTVAAPEITTVELDAANANIINVTVNALIGYDGGDQVNVSMKDADGQEIDTQNSGNDGSTHVLKFKPASSGTYTFTASLSRRDEEDKAGVGAKEFSFTFPLTKPHIKSATSKGKTGDSGSVEVAWDEVKEATSYVISYKKQGEADDTAKNVEIKAEGENFECLTLIKEGLEIGATYVFTVTAKRAGTGLDGTDESSEVSDGTPVEITAEAQVTWAFSIYGDSTSTSKNGYTDKSHVGKYNGNDMPLAEVNWTDGANPVTTTDDSDFVRVWSMGGAGKIVPANVDGLAFYYTEIDPNKTNFKLTATAHVNEIAVSNGQDGFGIMAADRVGTHGDAGKWWNNSYQALASKVEYRWNSDKAIPDYSGNTDYQRYSMKLGIGSTEKLGVTKENLPEFDDTSTVVAATGKYFKTDTKTLDTSTINLPGGTYNIIGNYSGAAPEGTQKDLLVTDLKFSIELNATGYFLSYTPVYADGKEGPTTTNKYYDRKALNHIDEDTVYVGFFASRNADVTFKDISFETRDFDPDEVPESRPVEKIVPAYSISSGSTANSEDYSLLFSANWPGKLTIKNSMGVTVVAPQKDADGKEINNVTADENGVIDTFKSDPVKLNIGVNTFQWTFTPDEDYIYDPNPNYGNGPSEPRSFTELSDYTAQTDTFSVTYKKYGNEGEALYVSPKGSAVGTGTKANPLDIYTAVKYVQSGQTIYLMEGTYNLSRTVTVGKGISGTVNVEYETDADGNIAYDGYDFKKVKSYNVEEYIYMLPAPGSGSRPVLDFGRVCEGLVVAGDAWYIKGIDVTKSQLSKDGMRVCGSYNIIEDVHTYNNGNTGLQISRFGSDSKDYWPSYNLILNCTSYLNADQGFEDADGFAAKLTIGQGNVFDGCIAAYNADDGWDLFAKVESGNIGRVVIKNSIAYRNGYVLIRDTDGDGKITNAEARDQYRELALDGIEYPAGNGNGFKMGGSNLPGGHSLYNSAAFYNAAKGIDSNSCPDIKAYNSISFNNEGSNVAFYGTITNSDFAAEGVISYRTDETYDTWKKLDDGTMVKDGTASYADVAENLKPSGTQSTDQSAFKNETSYFWDSTAKTSKNSKDVAVSADWFVKADNASFAEFENAMKADMNYARANGKINLHGFLELTDKVGSAAGEGNTGLGGAPSDEVKPVIPDDVPATGGDISSGDAGEETSSGVRSEDMDQYLANLRNSTDGKLGLWFNIVDSEDVYYTRSAVRPEIHVYDDTTLLTKNDYTIKYKNNVNAYVNGDSAYRGVTRKPTITVKGKGNYINQASEQHFNIYPVDFGNDPDDASVPHILVRDIAVETGKTGKIAPTVTYNGKKLAAGKDYNITEETSDHVKIKAVTGGNYTGEYDIPYRVVAKDKLAQNFKISSIPDQQRRGYMNMDIKQPIAVTLEEAADKEFTVQDKNGRILTYGEDYTIRYENNVEVGTATATFIGINDYAGAKDKKFRIVAPNINNLVKEGTFKIFEGSTDITGTGKLAEEIYKGAAIRKSGISVTHKGETLELDEDYAIVYKNNTKSGTASVIIKGIGNYSGNIEKRFKITPLDLNALPKGVTIEGTFEKDHTVEAAYQKGGSKPNVELVIVSEDSSGKVRKNRLIQGKDYGVSYQGNTTCGTATVRVKGRGGVRGMLEKKFTIARKDLSDPDITITAEDLTVSSVGKEFSRAPKIVIKDANGSKLTAGTDYDKRTIEYTYDDGTRVKTDSKNNPVVSIRNENDVLTITATVKAAQKDKCGYEGEISTEFRVGYAKQSLTKARVKVKYQNGNLDYTGQEVRLNQNGVTDDIEVTLNGKNLKYGEDFEIMTTPDYKVNTYKNNIKAGMASVTIIGIGNYTGTKEVRYKIRAKEFSWWGDMASQLINSL